MSYLWSLKNRKKRWWEEVYSVKALEKSKSYEKDLTPKNLRSRLRTSLSRDRSNSNRKISPGKLGAK